MEGPSKCPFKKSIALCTYNGAEFLEEQLDSFLTQTVLPDELVIGDDVSTDRTVSLIERFARHSPFPVHLEVNKKNLGSTRNFEKTIRRCKGDLIFLSDQDDVWMREKIATFERVFAGSDSIGLVFSDAELAGERMESLNGRLWDYTFKGKIRAKAVFREFYKTLLKGNVVTGATAAFRSRFTNDFLPIPQQIPNLIHDFWIALVISVSAEIRFIETPLIRYRQHATQQIGLNWSSEGRERFSKALDIHARQLQTLGIVKNYIEDFPSLGLGKKIEVALPEAEREIKEQMIHLENRLKLTGKKIDRIPIILTELTRRRYHRYSRGILSAGKDFFAS